MREGGGLVVLQGVLVHYKTYAAREDIDALLAGAVSPPPVPRLPPEEGAHCPQISFVPEEIRLFTPLTPETNRIAQAMHSLAMPFTPPHLH